MASAAPPRSAPKHSDATWGLIFDRTGDALGDDGRLLDTRAADAFEAWRGQSEYVAALMRCERVDRAKWLLMTGEVLLVVSSGLTVSGIVTDLGDLLYPLAAA